MIDGSLSANRRVDLRQQRCRHLDKRYATLVSCGCKANHVTDHPATKGDQRGAAVAVLTKEAIENQVEGRPIFVRFPVRQHDLGDGDALLLQAGDKIRQIQGAHDIIRHHGNALGLQIRKDETGVGEHPRPDPDRITAFIQFDVQSAHSACNSFSISLTIAWGVPRPPSTMMCATSL